MSGPGEIIDLPATDADWARRLRIGAAAGGVEMTLTAEGCIRLARILDWSARIDALNERVSLDIAARQIADRAAWRRLLWWASVSAAGALTCWMFDLYLKLRGLA